MSGYKDIKNSGNKDRLSLRAFSVWRKKLMHINKTRDNHFRLFGRYFDLTLVVCGVSGPHISDDGTKIVRINTFFKGLLGYMEFYIRAFHYFARNHRKDPYDFVLSPIGEEPIGRLISLFARPRLQLVYDLWDIPGGSLTNFKYDAKEFARKIYNLMLKLILRKGDVIISGVVSEGLRSFHIPSSKIIETENGVLLDVFNPLLYEANISMWTGGEGIIRLLYIGYLHEKRGGSVLLDVMHQLRRKNIQCELLMVGPSDIDAMNCLIAGRNERDLQDIVFFQEEISSDKIPEIILGADICLCPLDDIEKYRWSYPVKIYEYLALGKAVVASRLPGIESLIRHADNGLLYEAGNAQSLELEICKLVDKELREKIAENARESVMNKDWDKVVGDLAHALSCKVGANVC
jgi:glycosyltransferase involved in cell wall biosynthesis